MNLASPERTAIQTQLPLRCGTLSGIPKGRLPHPKGISSMGFQLGLLPPKVDIRSRSQTWISTSFGIEIATNRLRSGRLLFPGSFQTSTRARQLASTNILLNAPFPDHQTFLLRLRLVLLYTPLRQLSLQFHPFTGS